MIRVKIIKDYKNHKEGDIVQLSPNEAFGLIDSGYAIVTKDIVKQDYNTKVFKGKKK